MKRTVKIMMRNILVLNIDILKKVLESPSAYKYYRLFVPGKILSAEVGMYEHPDGARIYGRPGRWWIYVRVKYVLHEGQEEPYTYDIALWKLKYTPLFNKLGIKIVKGENIQNTR